MLKELAKLSEDMLFRGGYVTDTTIARRLAQNDAPTPPPRPFGVPRIRLPHFPNADWLTAVELLLLAAIWGGSFLFQRIAAPVSGAVPLVAIRLALGALVLSPFLWRERKRIPLSRWPLLAAIGVVNSLIPFLLFAWCAERAPAGVSAIVDSMAVPFAALAAFALFGERIGKRQLTGLSVGLVGVIVLASGNLAGASLGPAVAAGTLAALLYGISANLLKHYLADLPPLAVAAATLTCAAILLAPFGIWTLPTMAFSGEVWLCLAGIGVICTGCAYALYFRLIQRIGASRATTVTYIVPVFGVLWAWLALDEPLTISMAVGGVLILGGMLFVQGKSRQPKQRQRVVMDENCVDCGR